MTSLPSAPSDLPGQLVSVPPAGPMWRIWHPTQRTPNARHMRDWGPMNRFDPHPAGPPAQHPGVYVLYGALAFDVSALEVFNRDHSGSAPAIVDVCHGWRGTLLDVVPESSLFDLADEDSASSIGATVALGDTETADYQPMQSWARWLHGADGIEGLRYRSCRAKTRSGVATALFEKDAAGEVAAQHLLRDDALWAYVVLALDNVGVVVNPIEERECRRCGLGL